MPLTPGNEGYKQNMEGRDKTGETLEVSHWNPMIHCCTSFSNRGHEVLSPITPLAHTSSPSYDEAAATLSYKPNLAVPSGCWRVLENRGKQAVWDAGTQRG